VRPVKGKALTGGIATVLLAAALFAPSLAAAATSPLSQFGSVGTGSGQFLSPQGVAIDGSGNVYVAEGGSDRISVFNASGTFLRAFGRDVAETNGDTVFEVCPAQGACRQGDPGGGPGELDNPRGIAIDGSGNLYVVDQSNARIDVFNPAGPSFVRAFGVDVAEPNGGTGFEVCPNDGACRQGDAGSGPGQLSLPLGGTIDGLGNLYVADQSNHRISVFNTSGPTFTRAFGQNVDSSGGPGTFEVCTTSCQAGSGVSSIAGAITGPFGVAIDGSGNLYVTEQSNHRISVFNAGAPSFTRAIGWDVQPPDDASGLETCTTGTGCIGGDAGSGAGQVNLPRGLAVDTSGVLYAASSVNNRIDVFNSAGSSFADAFGFDVVPPNDGSGFELCTTGSGCLAGDSGMGIGQLNLPSWVTGDCRGAVWVTDAGNGRIQRFGEPGTPLPPCPVSTPPAETPSTPTTTPAASGSAVTGLRAVALKKCKKKRSAAARRKCKKKANLLPL
jgi:tripartite motif-containing protein 71